VEFPDLDAAFFVLAATVLVAGVARGLSGFGTGMIVAPVAGALYGPKAALAIIIIMDSLPTIPVTIPALRIARWGEVLPAVIGLILFIPAGVWILSVADPLALRWVISAAILLCAVALWRGWRYEGDRTAPKSLGVGAVAGILSGIAQIPGPPVLIYWLSSPLPSAIIRANLLSLFFISEIMSIATAWTSGLFVTPVVAIALGVTPVYFAGLLAGSAAYGRTNDTVYRRITLVLVFISAMLALPWREISSLAG
jgi:uncharacterized membrane protein YfcA